MSHYPCLNKSYIQSFLDENKGHLSNDWKNHLNSQILNKYIQIKREQEHEVSQILPKYQIFPKKYSQYNIYTANYDIDRLQRIKNGQNQKYQQKSQITPKNSKNKKQQDEYFRKTNSQLIMGNKNMEEIQKDIQLKSTIKFYDSKSGKSLAQTNISPSRISKKINNETHSKIYTQSDSQASLGQLQNDKINIKGRFLDVKSMQDNLMKRSDLKKFENTQSLISISAGINNYNQNEDYDKLDKGCLKKQPNKTSKKSQKHVDFGKQKLTQQFFQEQKDMRQVNRSYYTQKLNEKTNHFSSRQKAKQKIRFKQSIQNKEKTEQKNEIDENHNKILQIQTLKQQFNIHNQKTQVLLTNVSKSSNIDQKRLEYYGQEFQRIKAQRDYLRKYFIQHLQKRHTSQLPYNKLTTIDVNQIDQKLIVHTQQIPVQNHEKVSQTVQMIKIDRIN